MRLHTEKISGESKELHVSLMVVKWFNIFSDLHVNLIVGLKWWELRYYITTQSIIRVHRLIIIHVPVFVLPNVY